MIPIRDERDRGPFPYLTATIVILLAIVYFWDRNWNVFGPRYVFADMAARAVDIVSVFRGGLKEPLLTLFTSIFLHANLAHIIGNVLFLWVFGPRVEHTFGPWRFMIYYLVWGLFASVAQIFVMPNSGIPMLGASGAIAGVMGSYLLLHPAARIEVLVPPFIWFTFHVPAWLLLGMWFLIQIFVVQEGVANWAHAGGFLAGMLTVMFLRPARVVGRPVLKT
ncbi:MAG: rhomboid family intramembrane serine protease [Armatimonadetes bacterium]|nr:rhomboid family intramembrane serine protease [Armatimonadota bacterium]